MDAFEIRIWECMGHWIIVAVRISQDEQNRVIRETMYHAEHGPIDDEDPSIRLMQLVGQLQNDLSWTMADLKTVPGDS